MIESMTDGVSPDDNISSTSILAVIGFGIFLGAMAAAYVGVALSYGLSLPASIVCKGLGWTAFALVHFLSFRGMADVLFGFIGSGRLSAAIAVCAVPLPVVSVAATLGWAVPAWLAVICWILFGLATSSLMLSWGTIWSTVSIHRDGSLTIAQLTAWSLVMAAVLCVFMLFAPNAVAASALLAFMLGSIGLFYACHLRVTTAAAQTDASPKEAESGTFASGAQEGGLKEGQVAKRLITRAILTPLTRGISFGIVFFFVMYAYSFPESLGLVVGGMALAGLVITVVLRRLKHVPNVPSVERATFPVLAATLLLMPLAGPLAQVGLLLIALVALFYQFILNPDATSLRDEGAGAIYHCARENFVSIAGVLIGWAAQAALSFAGVPLGDALFGLTLVLVFLMVVEPAFIPYMSYVAIEQLASRLDGQGEGGSDERDAAGSWRQRCAAVCQAGDLSPRESEVFLLLAKGRNAEHIANELFISQHTARTHIYRIYRKLSVNSQQELIDLVDNT